MRMYSSKLLDLGLLSPLNTLLNQWLHFKLVGPKYIKIVKKHLYKKQLGVILRYFMIFLDLYWIVLVYLDYINKKSKVFFPRRETHSAKIQVGILTTKNRHDPNCPTDRNHFFLAKETATSISHMHILSAIVRCRSVKQPRAHFEPGDPVFLCTHFGTLTNSFLQSKHRIWKFLSFVPLLVVFT